MTAAPPTAAARGTRRAQAVVLVGILLLAVNLRAAVSSLGVLLGAVRDDLGISATLAGVLTTVPVLCFAGFGLAAPALARRIGLHRAALSGLLAVVAGLTLRGSTGSVIVFTIGTTIGLAGMALGNVLLPPVVKQHFPDRVNLVTGCYSAALMAGAALPTVVAVPVADAAGSWRAGLLLWAGTAAVAVLPWLTLVRHDTRECGVPTPHLPVRRLARSPLARAMAVCFGLQAAIAYAQFGWLPQIYADAGLSDTRAGQMLGVVAAVGIPVALLVPAYARRTDDHRPIAVTLTACSVVGLLGLLLAPTTLPALWAVFLGIGGCIFPWLLTMIGLRARTAEGTAALSGATQSIGYLIAAVGPFGIGLLNDLTGGWSVPVVVLIALAVPQVVLAWRFARPRYVEDELTLVPAAPRG